VSAERAGRGASLDEVAAMHGANCRDIARPMSIAMSAGNMLLGSVANKVLHIAKVPVLLVK